MKAITLAALVLMVVTAPALAQQVDIQTTPPSAAERQPDFLAPGLDYYEVTRPPETQWYPYDVHVRHDPAFIAPFSREYETATTQGRVGIAGWTSPSTPVGPEQIYRENNGWLAFGFAITWGAPPTAFRPITRSAAPPPAR